MISGDKIGSVGVTWTLVAFARSCEFADGVPSYLPACLPCLLRLKQKVGQGGQIGFDWDGSRKGVTASDGRGMFVSVGWVSYIIALWVVKW